MANKFFEWINKKINEGSGDTSHEKESSVVVEKDVESENTPQTDNDKEEVKKNIEKPHKDKGQEEKSEKDILPTIAGNNPIEKKANLMQLVVNQVKQDYRGVHIDLGKSELVIVVTDGILFSIVNNDDYISQLKSSLAIEADCYFGKVILLNNTPEHSNYKAIAAELFYGVETIQEEVEVNAVRARVTALQGSLKVKEVILDAQEIKTLKDARYNIGAMSQPYPVRTNHIAIDELDNSNMQFNKYASREHAHITYNEQYGFLLFADLGGIRENQMRTHIVRNNEWIEVEGTLLPKVLKDGDVIVLSKNVHLKFEIIK